MPNTPTRLSPDEIVALKQTLRAQAVPAESLGFLRRASGVLEPAPAVQIPAALTSAELSVCGLKEFLIDERRRFKPADGPEEDVDCAHVAALEIDESPVHVHMVTHEIYQILHGNGRMVFGNKVVPVSQGTVISIPPGVEHGLSSDDPSKPVRVLLTFTPGLAPKQKPAFRDEKILWNTTKQRIEELLGAGA